jgi:hypothetical protein
MISSTSSYNRLRPFEEKNESERRRQMRCLPEAEVALDSKVEPRGSTSDE